MARKVLFICKYNEKSENTGYSEGYGFLRKFSGLFNSARFVSSQLNKEHVESVVENAVDNNEIDRLVTKHKPDVVIIEALWVVPSKFEVLQKLHPKVTWIIRIHSKVPFLASEGIATTWFAEYLQKTRVIIAPNSEDAVHDLKKFAKHVGPNLDRRVIYLPNYYGLDDLPTCDHPTKKPKEVHIGCFGAIRPFKNQLSQAIAAMQFADIKNKKLFFHINSTRVEGRGESVLKNLRELFKASKTHVLVEHDWLPHLKFRELCAKMDFGIQCSFTETFNIVAADFVSVNVPIVVSPQISWLPWWIQADPTSARSILSTLVLVDFLKTFGAEKLNKVYLKTYNRRAIIVWINVLNKL